MQPHAGYAWRTHHIMEATRDSKADEFKSGARRMETHILS